jgi:hypothetical protein
MNFWESVALLPQLMRHELEKVNIFIDFLLNRKARTEGRAKIILHRVW